MSHELLTAIFEVGPAEAVQIFAADSNRLSALIMNDPENSTGTVYVGGDDTVTATGDTRGQPVRVATGMGFTEGDATAAVWAISASGTQVVIAQWRNQD